MRIYYNIYYNCSEFGRVRVFQGDENKGIGLLAKTTLWQSSYMYEYSGLALFTSVWKFSSSIHHRSCTDLEGVGATTPPLPTKNLNLLNF